MGANEPTVTVQRQGLREEATVEAAETRQLN